MGRLGVQSMLDRMAKRKSWVTRVAGFLLAVVGGH
jgi:hypothetical protein